MLTRISVQNQRVENNQDSRLARGECDTTYRDCFLSFGAYCYNRTDAENDLREAQELEKPCASPQVLRAFVLQNANRVYVYLDAA